MPVGIAALFVVQAFVDEPEQIQQDRREKLKHGLRIDYVGVILVALGPGALEIFADRGEREDWFSSPLIVTAGIVAVVALVSLVVWELNRDDPVIDLRLMKSRNLAMTLVVMTITGLILFGTTQLIPQMLQQVLGYSSLDAGLALTAGGIATLVAVPFAGQLTGKIDVRIILIGALLVQAALWNLSHFTADISFWDAATARLYQAMALPFLFLPINAVAYVGLPQRSTAQASALLNVAHNLGVALGISSAQTLLANYSQVHQSRLVENANPLNPDYASYLAQAQGIAAGGGGDTTALAIVYQTVQRQASMHAFIGVFWSLMILVLVVTPLLLLMRPGTGGKAKGGMGHSSG